MLVLAGILFLIARRLWDGTVFIWGKGCMYGVWGVLSAEPKYIFWVNVISHCLLIVGREVL
jgi:hypothetical protein